MPTQRFVLLQALAATTTVAQTEYARSAVKIFKDLPPSSVPATS